MPRSRSFHFIKSSFDPHQVHAISQKERVISIAMSFTQILDVYLTDDFNFILHPQAVSFLRSLYLMHLNFLLLYTYVCIMHCDDLCYCNSAQNCPDMKIIDSRWCGNRHATIIWPFSSRNCIA